MLGPGTCRAARTAPAVHPAPKSWRIRLTWSIWAAIVARIDHVSQSFHDNFRFVELVSESVSAVAVPRRSRCTYVPGAPLTPGRRPGHHPGLAGEPVHC